MSQKTCTDMNKCVFPNSIQLIENLKQILDMEDLSNAHILTFCKDIDDSILYITQAKSRDIEAISIKDHHGEQCFESKIQAQNLIKEEIDYNIRAIMSMKK